MATPPQPDEIEVSIFGPGFGEAVLVHLGGGKWFAIDSCIDQNKRKSAPRAYLEEIGVDPATQVVAIVASHWHSDHIKGLYDLLVACKSADFYFSDALAEDEFTAYISAFEAETTTKLTGGAKEFFKILTYIGDNQRSWASAAFDRRILNIPANSLPHNQACEIWTLSPSNEQYHDFLKEIISVDVLEKRTKFRAQPNDPNHLSVVCQVCIGSVSLLLGADLEEANHPRRGWQAIVASQARPQMRSAFFKIPHHGSSNGHYDPVWTNMLTSGAIAVVTPYTRLVDPLPTQCDIARIKSKTHEAYATARTDSAAFKPADKVVERTLKDMEATVKSIRPTPGRTTVRWSPNASHVVSLFDGAYQL